MSVFSTRLAVVTVGQISRMVRDIPRAVDWYREVLGLPHLFTFGDLAFFDCQGVRLYLNKCQVSDLSPLKSMPLQVLEIGQSPLTDLTPLQGLPLVEYRSTVAFELDDTPGRQKVYVQYTTAEGETSPAYFDEITLAQPSPSPSPSPSPTP